MKLRPGTSVKPLEPLEMGKQQHHEYKQCPNTGPLGSANVSGIHGVKPELPEKIGGIGRI